jgi:pimeloyl-ACP methyl ester carboxylesterase
MIGRIPFLMLSICLIALGDIATGGGTYANAESPGNAAARPAVAEPEISENVFEFEGRHIVYIEAGAGDTVYLAHGAACDYTDWRKQISSIGERFHVIAADEPFLGKSDPGPLPRDLRWSAAAIWALLDHLQVERVVFVGHSGGASLCREMYLARQARVRGFVSVDSGTGGKISSKERDKRTLVLPPAYLAQAEKNREALADMGRATDFPSDLNIAILRKHQAARQRYLKLVKRQRAPLSTKPDTPKWCKVPLLLFTSGRGRMGQEDLSPDWIENHAAGRDARVVVVRDTGHWIMLEQPEVFNRQLIRFLQSLP